MFLYTILMIFIKPKTLSYSDNAGRENTASNIPISNNTLNNLKIPVMILFGLFLSHHNILSQVSISYTFHLS